MATLDTEVPAEAGGAIFADVDFQYLVSTHSPLVLASAEPGSMQKRTLGSTSTLSETRREYSCSDGPMCHWVPPAIG